MHADYPKQGAGCSVQAMTPGLILSRAVKPHLENPEMISLIIYQLSLTAMMCALPQAPSTSITHTRTPSEQTSFCCMQDWQRETNKRELSGHHELESGRAIEHLVRILKLQICQDLCADAAAASLE